MGTAALSERDLKEIGSMGLTKAAIMAQLDMFARGISPVILDRPCTRGDGILVLDGNDEKRLIGVYEEARRDEKAVQFVPASGAASRMFKEWFDLAQRPDPMPGDTLRISEELPRYAFYHDLEAAVEKSGRTIDELLARGDASSVFDFILAEHGLNYGQLPKALIPFHRYPGGNRTPVEEHLIEGSRYITDGKGCARSHFTVSEEHYTRVNEFITAVRRRYGEKYGITFDISFSVQSSSTHTIAVDMTGKPFRDGRGRLVFRPGGHGGLLGNLNKINGDIVFIKNIDNVVPDRQKDEVVHHKKILGGLFVEMRRTIFAYLRLIHAGNLTYDRWNEIVSFCTKKPFLSCPDGIPSESDTNTLRMITEKLNRPLRVCGMVKNEGEPGGGPFWIREPDGSQSLQIVEKAQIRDRDRGQIAQWNSSTHFNPVDIVCGIKDFRGATYNLADFVDPSAYIISEKSMEGKSLKALELPGLWNGSMAKWNTLFVEVPTGTFNPVKTVRDLLRKEHDGITIPE